VEDPAEGDDGTFERIHGRSSAAISRGERRQLAIHVLDPEATLARTAPGRACDTEDARSLALAGARLGDPDTGGRMDRP